MGMVNGEELIAEISEKIRVEVTGEVEATAQLDLCVGVQLSFHVNGVGSELDIPVCLTALLEVAADADLSGAELNIDASLSLAELKLPFTLDLPDVSAVIDTACGFVQAPLDKMSPLTDCSPILTCFTNFVDDTCDGLAEAVSPLDIEVELGEVPVYDEQVIWSHTLTLFTGDEGKDSPARACTRYTGLNMSHKKAGKASLWTVTDTLKKCEDLCMNEKDCAMYTFVDDTKKFGPKCLTWTLDEARLHGRTNPEEWKDQKGYTSAVCKGNPEQEPKDSDQAPEEPAVQQEPSTNCSKWNTDGGWYRGEYINDEWISTPRTWQECAERCVYHEECEFWTLQPNGGDCLLMKNRGEYVPSSGHLMGPRDEQCSRD